MRRRYLTKWFRRLRVILVLLVAFGGLGPMASTRASGTDATPAEPSPHLLSRIGPGRALSADDPMVEMTDDSWESPLGFSLEWGREWAVLAADYAGGVETMILGNDTATIQLVALMDYGGDADLCLADLSGVARDLFADADITARRRVLDSAPGLDHDAAFTVFDAVTNDFRRNETVRIYVGCQQLVAGESIFGVVLISDQADFAESIADFQELMDAGFELKGIEPRDPAAFREQVAEIAADVDRFYGPVLRYQREVYVRPAYLPFLDAIETPCYQIDPEGGPRAERDYELLPGAAAVHCGIDRTIYVDQAWMETYVLPAFGEAGVALILAHEVGHHIQESTGWIRQFDPDDPDDMYVYETSADCFAGAYLRSTVSRHIYAPDEIYDLDELMQFLGDPEEGMGHGTGSERIDAFTEGYEEGVDACGVFDG